MTTAEHGPVGADEVTLDHWDRQVVWWDVSFVAIFVLTAIGLPLSGVTGTALWTALAAMAVVLAAYALWGARAARSRDQRLAVAYVAVLVVGTAVAVAQGGMTTFLLFGAYTQLWMLLEPIRRSVAACVVLTVAVTFGIAFQEGFDVPTLISVAPQMGVALAFAIMLGLWFAVVMRRSDERAELIHELREAQAELAHSNHAAGVAAERERIAREIHDTLAQGFTSIVMQAQAGTAALDRGEADATRHRLRLVEATARDNLAEARALVAAFAPVPLQGATLTEALHRLGERFTDETGIAVRVDVPADGDGVGSPGPAADVVLLRAAQEALANVRRHAGAAAVTLRLVRDREAIELEVADDGRGLPAGHEDGFGLAGMRERAAAAGGSLDVGAAPGGGTAVRLRLPAAGTT